MRLNDLSQDKDELNLPINRSIDTKEYREAYAELMRTSPQTRAMGLTYLGFLSRMRKRNLARAKMEFERRRIIISKQTNPELYEAIFGKKEEV